MDKFEELLDDVITDSTNYSETENGAYGFKTTKNKLVDLNFILASLRWADEDVIIKFFKAAYNQYPEYTLKWLFFARDIRCGIGERRFFRVCMNWLYDNHPEVVKSILNKVAEFGRWDDVIYLARVDGKYNELNKFIVNYVCEQLEKDIQAKENNKPVSLLAKWMPSNNTSSKETVKYAIFYQKQLGYSPKQYRKTLSSLRAYLDVVERKMSANQWDEVKYSAVPSKAMLNYRRAFENHDGERYIQYIEDVKAGKQKINAAALFPYEIVHAYVGNALSPVDVLDESGINETLEQQWKALPELFTEDTLVVRDGSGSMQWGMGSVIPLDVSTALAIYTAQHNKGRFKDTFITFSEEAKLIKLEGKTLYDNLMKVYEEDECTNTNIFNVFDLILQTAVKGNFSQEDIPRNVVIISDMEFDANSHTCRDETRRQRLFDRIEQKYNEHGYKLPKLIFWNVSSRTGTIPTIRNENGLTLVSGFSVNVLKMISSDELDPWLALKEVLDSERYKDIKLS